MNKTPAKMGRRPMDPSKKLTIQKTIRLKPEQLNFVMANGGTNHIRNLIIADMALRGGEHDCQ